MLQKNIFFILLLSMIGVLTISLLQKDEISIIQSDGKGYYAYLPALFIHHENDFIKTNEVERKYFGDKYQPTYLNVTEEGKTYNKYFPGVAILQTPSFLLAYFIAYLTNSPLDGYSNVFQLCFFFSGLIYTILGLFFFAKSLSIYFPKNSQLIQLFTIFAYLSTPLLVYSLELISYSHIYSFFLFGWFSLTILQRKNNAWFYLKIGIILGLIFLVRPTNILVLFILPFLLKTAPNFKQFFTESFSNRGKNFWISILPFFAVVSLQFILWKWQTGDWMVNSYQGEGFDFFHPHLFDALFSFRIGLFIHTPLLFLSLFGIILIYKENRFSAISWSLYFLLNLWVISSWWCWDYESYFGNRPFTEHLFFLLFPIVILLKKYPKIGFSMILFFSLLGFLRFYQFRNEIITTQRFTSENYISSLFYLKHDSRWQFTHSCRPIGKEKTLFYPLTQRKKTTITSDNTFAFGSEIKLKEEEKGVVYHFSIEMDKKVTQIPFFEVLLVIEAIDNDSDKHFYHTFELYNDKLEGENNWKHLLFEQNLSDFKKEYDEIKIYLWNKGKKEFFLKNVQYRVLVWE